MVGNLTTLLEEEQIKTRVISSIENMVCLCFSHWNFLVRVVTRTKRLGKFDIKFITAASDLVYQTMN